MEAKGRRNGCERKKGKSKQKKGDMDVETVPEQDILTIPFSGQNEYLI